MPASNFIGSNIRVSTMALRTAVGAAGGADVGTWTANNTAISAIDAGHFFYYRFDTGALTTDSKDSNDMSNTGAVGETSSGKESYAALFSGASQALGRGPTIPEFNFGSGDLMVDCWVYPTDLSSDKTIWSMVSSFDGNARPLVIYVSSAGVTNALFNWTAGGPSLAATTTMTVNNWWHVAVTRVGSRFDLYINGTSEDNATYAPALHNPLNIAWGTFYSDSYGTNQWVGRIDEGSGWKAPAWSDQAQAAAIVSARYNSGDGAFLSRP